MSYAGQGRPARAPVKDHGRCGIWEEAEVFGELATVGRKGGVVVPRVRMTGVAESVDTLYLGGIGDYCRRGCEGCGKGSAYKDDETGEEVDVHFWRERKGGGSKCSRKTADYDINEERGDERIFMSWEEFYAMFQIVERAHLSTMGAKYHIN